MEQAERLADYIEKELRTRREQGCETWELERRLKLAQDSGTDGFLEELQKIRRDLDHLEADVGFPYSEPCDLERIRAERPQGPRSIGAGVSGEARRSKVLGGWTGRVAGCMLGKPVEGWDRQHIQDVLEVRDAYPLDDYFPPPAEGEREEPDHGRLRLLRGHVEGGVRDDDTDYTVVGLRILERHGTDFSPRDVAEQWLVDLPFARTYTAERAAYRNFVNGVWPPESARERNPYREWIGAQIRADVWGYISPGSPQEAATLAYRDASISHTRNGIYGEMWVAAMLGAAFVTSDPVQVLRIGLSEIPGESRLAEAVRNVMQWSNEDRDAEQTLERITERYADYSDVHTINNAAIVAAALLWGGGDFTRSVGLAVMGGLDTDCNGATVGSLLGVMLGEEGIAGHWKRPLHDTLETAIAGEATVAISQLAERTLVMQESK
jgi:ADP-ribosylglycohydrolase